MVRTILPTGVGKHGARGRVERVSPHSSQVEEDPFLFTVGMQDICLAGQLDKGTGSSAGRLGGGVNETDG